DGYSRLVRLTDLREDLSNQGVYVDEAAHNYLSNSELFGGEVLLANVGAHAGYVCLMPEIEFKATLGPNMMLIRFHKDIIDVKFAYLAMSSEYLQSQLKLRSVSAAQPKLNKEDVRDCVILVPPLREQPVIAEHIKRRVERADDLMVKTERSIEILKERRSALITAAVTGQIDLREHIHA
ncbi:restriction endonuclease subunit S, partial [Arthrospira platensis SPKY1]|nr:restriction endonuclease subunit S [Arthrospira platensis SPKY1]